MCLCSPVRLSLPCSCLQHHSGWLIKAALIDRALEPWYSALFCSFLCDNPCISQSRLQVNTTVSRTSKLRKLRLNGFFSPRGQAETQNCTTTPGLMCFTSQNEVKGWLGAGCSSVQAFSCLLVSLAPG